MRAVRILYTCRHIINNKSKTMQNKLYASFPSNNATRDIKLLPVKDPRKVFIGGLVIGVTLGVVIGYILLATLITINI